jgi:hypothetical protein
MQSGDFGIWYLYFVLIVVLYETVRRLRRGYKHVDEIECDERTNRITKQSLSVSWCLTFVTVGTLAFACIFRPELLTARLVITAVSGGCALLLQQEGGCVNEYTRR